jgi:hypothetical protein
MILGGAISSREFKMFTEGLKFFAQGWPCQGYWLHDRTAWHPEGFGHAIILP